MTSLCSRVLRVRNVNQALSDALWYLQAAGVRSQSRNGKVLVAPGPVITEYTHPSERVLLSSIRDANPFFHLMESLWMLGGRNDVAFVAHYAKNMANYSDDGEVLHGAYGFRWREWFGFDQLAELVTHLRKDRDSRRAVLSMWSPQGDLIASEGYGGLSSKDLPCNTSCYVDLRNGVLNLGVLCRSNDAIWGAYGANAVHFSVLQEYLAMQLRVAVGTLEQFSWNLHVYTDVFNEAKLESMRLQSRHEYETRVQPHPLLQSGEDAGSWERDLERFLESQAASGYYCAFFQDVASPMQVAWERYKRGDLEAALRTMTQVCATDWQLAGTEWLERRLEARKATS